MFILVRVKTIILFAELQTHSVISADLLVNIFISLIFYLLDDKHQLMVDQGRSLDFVFVFQSAPALRCSLNICNVVPHKKRFQWVTEWSYDFASHSCLSKPDAASEVNSQKWLFVDDRSKPLLWPGSRWLPLVFSHHSLQKSREKNLKLNTWLFCNFQIKHLRFNVKLNTEHHVRIKRRKPYCPPTGKCARSHSEQNSKNTVKVIVKMTLYFDQTKASFPSSANS